MTATGKGESRQGQEKGNQEDGSQEEGKQEDGKQEERNHEEENRGEDRPECCPEARNILFQGDSITDGNRGRDSDPNHILGHGYAFWIAAERGFALAKQQPAFVNRGISGNRVSDLEARWTEDAIDLRPDTISILIGVNDILTSIAEPGGFDPASYEADYRRLLARTRRELPAARLVLCEPFILPGGHTDYDWAAWNAAARACGAAVRRLADEFGAVFVPLQDAFDAACELAPAAYWIWDGVHPTTAGHGLLARRWLDTVQASAAAII